MEGLKRKLEITRKLYKNIAKDSKERNDPIIYTIFLESQITAYENVLKYIYNKEIESKKVFED